MADDHLEKFVNALSTNRASVEDVARVLGDALNANITTISKDGLVSIEPDTALRLKASDLILKALKIIGSSDQPVSLTQNNQRTIIYFVNPDNPKENTLPNQAKPDENPMPAQLDNGTTPGILLPA
jgi:hypothetical protein